MQSEKERVFFIIFIIISAELQVKTRFFSGEKSGIKHSSAKVENDEFKIAINGK